MCQGLPPGVCGEGGGKAADNTDFAIGYADSKPASSAIGSGSDSTSDSVEVHASPCEGVELEALTLQIAETTEGWD